MKNLYVTFITPFACRLAVLICCAGSLMAQSGVIPAVDSSFNLVGQVHLQDIIEFEPTDQVVQPDGKILVAGYGKNDESDDFDGVMYRVNADGSLDNSFGNNGLIVLDIDGTEDWVVDLAVQADEKIMVVLQSNHRNIFARLLSNGSYDPNFGNEGLVLAVSAASEFFQCMQIQPDGKYVVSGFQEITSTKNKGVIRRYNADGSKDTDFGTNGYVSVVIDATKSLELIECVLQPDGKILATGGYGTGAGSGFPVIRLNANGTFDNEFSGDGIYFNTMGSATSTATAECIVVNAEGNIFVGGTTPYGTENVLTVLCVKPNGTINGAFGNFGVARVPFTIFASGRDMLIQPDGKLLLAGYSYITPTTTGLIFTRMHPNGQPDNTFGNQQSRFATRIDVDADLQIINEMGLAPDGRLVASAWLANTVQLLDPANVSTCYLIRYLTDITTKADEPSPIFREASIFPNPVGENGTMAVSYDLEHPCAVMVALYDITGREISVLNSSQERSAGAQQEKLNLPNHLAPGTYFVLLSTGTGYKALRFVKE